MTIRPRLTALAAFAALSLATPALAQDVPADANKALWCATAFTIAEPQARAQGQAAVADNFIKYAKTLTTTSHDLLIKAGFTEDQIKTQTAAASDKVNKELTGGTDQPEFTVIDCTTLVDPQAAAAIKAQEATDAATPAPADAAAPNAAPAPAAPAADATTPATPAPASK